MNGNNTGITTLSVRQLATLIGRSEQTVRRWNDQGKLIAEQQPGEGGGGLVFTVDAVREFIRKNPRLLDKAKPELIELLNGNQAYIQQQAADSAARFTGRSAAKTAAAASLLTTGLGVAALPVVVGGAALTLAEKILGSKEEEKPSRGEGGYRQQLLLAREAEVDKQLARLEEELVQIEAEQSRDLPRSEYVARLLQARAAEIHQSMDSLRQELEQIKTELNGGA